MRQTDFSRLHTDSSTDQCHIRNGVVWRAKRPCGDERSPSLEFPRDRVYLRGFQTLCQCERRENRRQPLRHHALATARTSHKQEIVSTRSGHFKSALHGRLSFHLTEIIGEIRLRGIKLSPCIHLCWLQRLRAFEMLHHIAELTGTKHLQLIHHRSFACILFWHYQSFIAQLARQYGRWQHTTHRAQVAIKS